jgi:hypothetical protein
MARVVGNIPTFINGISQQPPALRLPSQGQAQRNCYSTVARGLLRRPPTETLAKVSNSFADNAFVTLINRDSTEQYVVIADTTASNTSPNVLTAAEFSGVDFSTTAGATDASNSTSPVDGVSAFRRITFDGTDTASFFLSDFHTLTGNTNYTFSCWLRLVSGTLTDINNVLFINDSDVTAEGLTSFNSLQTGIWTKVSVQALSVASPTGTAINVGLRCDDVAVIDFYAGFVAPTSGDLRSTVSSLGVPQIRIFDFEGVEQQVWIPGGQNYILNCASPETNLRGLTVADFTYMINKTITVAKASTTATSRPFEALLSFGTIQPGSDIKVAINGSVVATSSVSDTDPTQLDTNYQANVIRGLLAAAGYNTAPWTCVLTETEGSVIYLANSSVDFDVTVRDASNGLGIKVIKQKVQYFEDLPRQGRNGFVVEIAGDPVTGFGNYWVKFDGDNDGIATWSETCEPGILTELDSATMPHLLVRNASSTFTFKAATWDARAKGDDDSNPFPSFIGETIKDIFFAKARLAFVAGEGLIMSEAGEFYNFFRTTVTTLVDGDPIDVGTNHTKVSILRHAVPYQEQLLLFSDQTQFRLTQGDILSPATVGIEPITEFESSINAKPAAVGNYVFFAVEKSDYASIREYYVADDSQRNDAREVTGHVPAYLTGGISQIEGSSNEDVLLIKSDGSPLTLFVYKYFWSANEKLQSSWSEWDFPDVTAILGYGFIRSTLYLVLKRADGVFLEKMELDVGAEDGTGADYNLRLDRKLLSTNALVSANYDAIADETTYTFEDIVWKSVPKVVGISGNSVENPAGYYVAIVGNPTTYNSNEIVVAGDTTDDDFMFGIPFTSEYTISKQIPRKPVDGGGSVPVTEGRLQILWMNIRYSETGYFKIQVAAQGRDTNEYEFNARTLATSELGIGEIPISEEGSFRFPVLSKNDRVSIKIVSDDVLPMRIIAADWIGNFIQKYQRM